MSIKVDCFNALTNQLWTADLHRVLEHSVPDLNKSDLMNDDRF